MKRNIIITGGGLVNKGAQAMTFIVVDEMKKRYPDYDIYLLSAVDINLPAKIKEQYTFKFMGWYPMKFAKCQNNPLYRMLCMLRGKKELLECEQIYKKCDCMIDISGYALGSNWSSKICFDYLENFEFAKAFNIPVYLMPQSFGPFKFEGEDGDRINAKIKTLFPNFKCIYAREQDGYEELRNTYNLNNVKLAPDMVLNNKGISLDSIYKTSTELSMCDIVKGSVGVIPNMRNVEVGNREKVLALYDTIIQKLIESEKTVYLLSHSNIDKALCEELKERFSDEEKVCLLENDFSCLEFNEIVKQFDYLIASRFHSIVHAFKNGIPCIALGWAVKYKELLEQFEQGQFMFDIRDNIDTEILLESVGYLNKHYAKESKIISSNLEEVQKRNLFDVIQI